MASRRAGHSGRRILHERWPHLWASEPMSEEAKEKLRALTAERRAASKTRAGRSVAKYTRKLRAIRAIRRKA